MRKRIQMKKILYYPTIRIEDGCWLRNAILYWDEVSSIIPGTDYDEFNSPEVEYLQSANIYRPVYPLLLEQDRKMCDQFCLEVKSNLKHRRMKNIREEYASIHREKLAMGRNSMLHINKTPVSILDYLRDEGIIGENCDGPWIDMKTTDAEIYMATLAKYLAKIEGNTDIGTDRFNKFYYPYEGSRLNKNFFRLNRYSSKKTDRQIYISMAIQEILPVPDMRNVPLESIIDFRKEYDRELHLFRRRIENFQGQLEYRMSNLDEFKDATARFRQEIDEDLQNIEELLNKKRISFRRCSLKTLIPAIITAGIGYAAGMGEISALQAIAAEFFINIAGECMSQPSLSRSSLSESNAYLFYAADRGFIKTKRNR